MSAASSKPSAAAILALDYGRARIGLAIAEAETALPRPLTTLHRENRNEDMRRLRELAREYGVKKIIVGLPLRLDGTRGEMAEEAERFANRVRKQIGVIVELADERLTSWEAERIMEEELGKKIRAEKTGKRESGADVVTADSVAATVILREYLEREKAK